MYDINVKILRFQLIAIEDWLFYISIETFLMLTKMHKKYIKNSNIVKYWSTAGLKELFEFFFFCRHTANTHFSSNNL